MVTLYVCAIAQYLIITHQVSLCSDLEPERDVALTDGLDERAVGVAHADLLALPPVVAVAAVQHVRRTVVDYLRWGSRVAMRSWQRKYTERGRPIVCHVLSNVFF